MSLKDEIDLSANPFEKGFTLETWVYPSSALHPGHHDPAPTVPATSAAAAPEIADSSLPTRYFNLFSLEGGDKTKNGIFPLLFIDSQFRVVLKLKGNDSPLVTSTMLMANAWNHVAMTFKAGSARTISLIVGGETPSATGSAVLPANAIPGGLKTLVTQPTELKDRFQGALDEIRLWSYPFEPTTIKSRMSTRLTGMESFLEACWHLDEAAGPKAFDTTKYQRNLDIKVTEISADGPYVWSPTSAPMLGSIGLSRTPLRLDDKVLVQGGLDASLYYEQVIVKTPVSSEPEGEAKPLKRAGRVLLCFVSKLKEPDAAKPDTAKPDTAKPDTVKPDAAKPDAAKPKTPNPTLSILDFGLLVDGSICGLPAIIPVPSIKNTVQPDHKVSRASTNLLYVDPQGLEVFGGLLDFTAAGCSTDPPCVWDSATGSVTIYYKSGTDQKAPGSFASLTYDITRSMEPTALNSLFEVPGLMASSNLRLAKLITISTMPITEISTSLAIKLKIHASMPGGKDVEEEWNCKLYDPHDCCQN
jgi:Concanavalin A-like lectin/glucanases superfamily